jgi:hypothetical protein
MKKELRSLLGRAVIASASVPALYSAVIPGARAQMSTDDYFGGDLTGEDFAGEAGLGSGDLPSTIASIINVALGFLGIVAVVIILLGGFKWMTAGGNDDKVKEAKKLMIAGVIGLVIILSAYAIASFVLTQISSATA